MFIHLGFLFFCTKHNGGMQSAEKMGEQEINVCIMKVSASLGYVMKKRKKVECWNREIIRTIRLLYRNKSILPSLIKNNFGAL